MYIEPNTDIYLLSGINWTNNYTDTVYFSNKSVQYNYMKNKVVKAYTKQSYQRHSKRTLRILGVAENLFSCNYLMFQNTSYGSKWFYAFITNCEYINDNTTEITYEIDEIQTWFWDLQLGQCFVEREIPVTDGLYENLVPESLECGEYECGAYLPVDLGEPYYMVQCSTNFYGGNDCTFCNGFPSTLYITTCPVNDAATSAKDTDIYKLLSNWIRPELSPLSNDNTPENVINISIIPEKLAKTIGDDGFPEHQDRGEILREEISIPVAGFSNFHGYKPKNKKLFTFPYTMLRVSNNSGQIVDYKIEDFKTTNILDNNSSFGFIIIGVANGLPSIALLPIDYNGVYEPQLNIDNAVVMTNFPTAPWVCDSYRAYLAQNKASIATSILSSMVGSGLSILTGNMAGNIAMQRATEMSNAWTGNSKTAGRGQIVADYQGFKAQNDMLTNDINSIASVGQNIAGHLAKINDMRRAPDSVSGLTNADMLLVSIGRQRFDIYNYSIKPEMAKIIDDYFSMYGYAQHKVKIPNINSRPYWNYTKTQGCILKGSAPASSKSNICKIFDNGIRFWNSNEVVGDYTRDNRP